MLSKNFVKPEYIRIFRDKPLDEENLSQPLPTKKRQIKETISFLIGYKDIFKIASKSNKLYITTAIGYDDFSEIFISQGA